MEYYFWPALCCPTSICISPPRQHDLAYLFSQITFRISFQITCKLAPNIMSFRRLGKYQESIFEAQTLSETAWVWRAPSDQSALRNPTSASSTSRKGYLNVAYILRGLYINILSSRSSQIFYDYDTKPKIELSSRLHPAG